MSSLSITLLIIGVILLGLSGCRRYNKASATSTATVGSKEVAASTPMPVEVKSSMETEASVTIDPVAVYGWWWSDEQLERDFDADNPPPKKSYIRLDRWDASQPDSPHPDSIDLICRLENHTDQPMSLSVEAFADFKVASYESIAQGSGTQQAVDEKLRQIKWSDNQKVGKLVIDTLPPGEAREARFKDFQLRSVIDKYLRPNAGDLWPWKLRISIIAKNSKGVNIAFAEATIDLIPGD